jgi:signal transduction histidine kinase
MVDAQGASVLRRWLSGLAAGAVLVTAASGLLALLEPQVPDLRGLAPVYVLAVLPVALRWGAGPGAAVAVASAVAYMFLFVPPQWSFAIGDARYAISPGVFLLTAVVIAYLAASSQRGKHESARLLAEQAALRRVATLVATGTSPAEVSRTVAEEVRGLIGVDDAGVCRFEPDGTAILVAGLGAALGCWPRGTRWVLDDVASVAEVWHTWHPARFDADRWERAPGLVAAKLRERGARSVAAGPVIVGGRLWGAVMVCSGRASLPADTDLRLARFTELGAMAIGNADSSAELAASRARIVAASDEARRRIERDLHDGAQQRLVSLGLELRLAEAGVPDGLPAVRDGIGRVADDLSAVLDELREMAQGIHPAMLANGGLGPALRALARRASVPVELDLATDARFPRPVEGAAYYVASEALTNAAKHADASCVNVTLAERDGALHLSVRDNGVGGAEPQRGSGLIGLRDRVEALGGTIEVMSPQGAGTTVLVTLPTAIGHGPLSAAPGR